MTIFWHLLSLGVGIWVFIIANKFKVWTIKNKKKYRKGTQKARNLGHEGGRKIKDANKEIIEWLQLRKGKAQVGS